MQTVEWNPGRPWQEHPATYRAPQMKLLAQWIDARLSGSVVGWRGSGRSNLLGFLCHRPEVLRTYLSHLERVVILVPVDLNNLPARTLSAFYRVILRAFYEIRHRLPPNLQTPVAELFQTHRAATDPFLAQSALRELLLHAQACSYRVVLVMDRFDACCPMLTPAIGNTLSGLRDSFRDTLSYIVGVRQSLTYLEPLNLPTDLLRLLTAHTCYLGPYTPPDARQMIAQVTRGSLRPPVEVEVQAILTLSGGYPTLIKAVCDWWLLTTPCPPLPQWQNALLTMPVTRHSLHELWQSLTSEEQEALGEVLRQAAGRGAFASARRQRFAAVCTTLVDKGICRLTHLQGEKEEWSICSSLLAAYTRQASHTTRGALWLDEESQQIYQGQRQFTDLAPKEHAVLHCLLQQPNMRQSYTDLITSAWSVVERYHGVTNDSLFQVVRSLRQKIEADPSRPRYLVNWRGKPEGGYLLYPEGRPEE